MSTVTFPASCTPKQVLLALWEKGNAVGLGFLVASSPPTEEEIQRAIDIKWVDYLGGKPIKCKLDNFPTLSSAGYDRDNGQGAMARVALGLSDEMKTN